jgi:hypothetical protein
LVINENWFFHFAQEFYEAVFSCTSEKYDDLAQDGMFVSTRKFLVKTALLINILNDCQPAV